MIGIKKLLTVLITLAVVFVLLPLAVLYFTQERLLFRPAVLAQNYAFRFARPFEEIRLPAADGTVLHGLHFAADAPAKGRLLFFHGNAGALDSWGEVAERFAALGYESYVFDYRGYGKSGGQIDNQDQLYADAERMAEYVRAQGEGRLVVVGFSLGSGLAARTAQQYRTDSLLLAAPYEGLAVLQREKAPFVPPFLIKYRIPSAEFLRAAAHTRITLVHGRQDTLIPVEHSRRLAALLKQGDAAFETDAGHNTLLADPLFWRVAAERL